MPDDPDTDVVKIIIGKDRYIPPIVSQSVTQVTAGLAVEQFPAALRCVADGILISRDEMIEWSIERNERALVSGNSGEHVLLVHVPTKRLDELPLVIRVAGNLGDGVADAGRAHLEGIRDRQRRLLLESIDPAVPELRLVIESIQKGWRVALTSASADADRDWPAVGEGARGIVAGRTGNRAVTREPAIEEELLPPARLRRA